MLQNHTFTAAERFMRYVQVDTQSDPQSPSFPSTEKQKILSGILAAELKQIGIADAHADEYGYVYATIPSNTPKKIPVVCFCAHVDTAPDCSGTNVKPILHRNYNGQDLILPDDPSQVITTNKYPYLLEHVGGDIITASGLTLLGADDKAGVSIIMDMANHLVNSPEIVHGDIKILFTPDEEVGRGTARLDLAKLNADLAYTLDGGELATFEDETFSADGATIVIHGIIAHPGYAKDKLVNAIRIAGAVLEALPQKGLSPETTEGREGFIHPVRVEGLAEKATLEFIIRDFDTKQLAVYEEKLRSVAEKVVAGYPGASMDFIVEEQYRNMKEILVDHPRIAEYAGLAYQRAGLQVVKEPIRGGTDGSRLSFMGLPCPNIFTGMQAIHSRHEWIGVRDMQKAVEVLVNLVQVWEENS